MAGLQFSRRLLSEQLAPTCPRSCPGGTLTQAPAPVQPLQDRPSVHAPCTVRPASPQHLLISVFFPKICWTGLHRPHPAPALCGPGSFPRISMQPAQEWMAFRKNGLVSPSHILASVSMSFQFSFHPLSRTNQNNPSILKTSSSSAGMVGPAATPESRGVDVRAQNWFSLPTAHPRWGDELGPGRNVPEKRGVDPFPAATFRGSCQGHGTLVHSALPVADLQQGREVGPQSQSPKTPRPPQPSRGAGSHR